MPNITENLRAKSGVRDESKEILKLILNDGTYDYSESDSDTVDSEQEN